VLYEPNHPLNNASKEQGWIIGPSDYITSAWSGGTTTELASYPFGADFSSRQFLWRVSIASVGKDGTFTRFEDTKRILMVLKGAIQLRHEGEHERDLLPFEQDKFSGNFLTFAKIQHGGGATNLNLMLKDGAEGEMLHIALESGLSHQYAWAHNLADGETHPCFSQAVDLLYNVDGELRIRYSNSTQEFYIHPGESFFFSRKCIDCDGNISIYNTGNALANIVAVRIIHA
tara:strand:- start:5 stop:694 length:690 start_codon:yes stop_codon:yes gene_type:complete